MGFEGRNRLFAIAARQDASGATGAAVVRAFATAQDGAAADEAARIATTANRQMTAAGRLAIAGALLEAGRADAAQAMLASAEAGGRLGPEERRQADALRTGIAVRASDQLNEQGDQAAGFERLRPALARTPADPSANLALARLHQGARQPQEALRIAEAVLLRDPRNMEARAAVMDAAIAARDIRRAEAMLAEARAAAPQDPRVLLLEARLARAVGDSRRAERALLEAAERRRAQTGADRASLAYAAGRAPGAAATIANPFRQAAGQPAGAAASDPLWAEIARELAALREESATRFALTPGLRTRSGSAGLDRLDEISARAEASIAAGMAGGRVTFGATPVMLSAGDLDNDVQARRRFGTNALAGPSGGRAPTDTTASGMGLDIGWRRGAFAVDVGTTPLGFETTNIVGGVEFAPALTDRMRLRVTGERRAMTDSLLSYGGQRDPLTGRSWGGVVRTGGRAQIEFSAGPATFYAGGGFAQLDGQGVADNNRIEAGAGMSYTVYRRLDEELTAGLDLVYFAYDRNLRYFTLGHGGYFSPQSYAALNVPVDWRARSGDLSWRLGATVGFASWQEDEAPLFPGDAGLQGRLVAAAASDPTLRTTYAGQTEAGFTGGLRADLEYQLSTQLRVGAGLRYDQAADWNETRGFAYLRYLLGD
jgi:Tfp pilus assembly protein PilF